MKSLYSKVLIASMAVLTPFFGQAQSCSPSADISTYAGNHTIGFLGDGGSATAGEMGNPFGVACDPSGNVFIADFYNDVVREVLTNGNIITIAGIPDHAGFNGDNLYGNVAMLNGPHGLAVYVPGGGGHEILYIADEYNERVRALDLWTGIITTVAGTGKHGGINGDGDGNGGPAVDANLDFPVAVAVDCSGNIYEADLGSQTVRKIVGGTITRFAGTGKGGYNGDLQPATSAQLNNPSGVAADCSGNVYIADAYNNRVRRVDVTGNIITVAGNGVPGYSGDGDPGGSAQLWIPNGVTLDGCGNLYICDWQNNVVRFLDLTSTYISTFAGNNIAGYDGDGGANAAAELYLPASLAIDGVGNIFIADYGNYVIRAIGNSLPNGGRKFRNGTTQNTTVNVNTTTAVNEMMAIPDATGGLTENWSVSIQPLHGTLSGFPVTAKSSTGNTIPTGGLTYTPAAGYVGPDVYTVIMNDGATSASTTINVNVVKDNTATNAYATLFPNPNNGSFKYQFTSATDCQLELNVTDVTGRIVYTQSVTATAGANVVIVNLPSNVQRPGLFTVMVGNDHTKYPAAKLSVTE